MADTKPTGADYGLTYANVGISAITNIAGALLSVKAFESQIKAQTDNKIANMNNIMDNYEYESYKLQEDITAMDALFADKISERALQGMKDFATMKAASAETGTSGGSTDEAVIQAHADMAFDVAIINQKRRLSNLGAIKTMEKSKMDTVSAIESLASGMVDYESDSFLAGLAGFSSGLGGVLSTMPRNVAAEVFSFDMNANKVDVMASKK